MIHDERAHDHLTPEDVPDHLHGHHPTTPPGTLASREEVEAWFERVGAEPTGDPTLDKHVYVHHLHHDEDERPATVVRLLAQVLASTQVPRSLGRHVLGAATEPWDALRQELDLFGYPDVDDHEKALRKALGLKEGG